MSIYANLNQRAIPPYDFSGSLAGSGAQLLLPAWPARSLFMFQNNGSHDMCLWFGGATAHATLTSGVVTSITVDNGGFGYTYAPKVKFFGGGYPMNGVTPGTEGVGIAFPGAPDPITANKPAAHANLTTGAVSSITVDNGGDSFVVAPYVYLENDPRDPKGAGAPTTTTGIYIAKSTGPFILKAELCPLSQVAVIGTSGDTFTCYASP